MSSPDDERCRHRPRSALPTTRGLFLGLQPPGAQLERAEPAARQRGVRTWVLRAPSPVTRMTIVGKSPAWRRCFPAADAFFKTIHGVDYEVQIFVFRPTGRTDDERIRAKSYAQPPEQRLPEPFAFDPFNRSERRRGVDRTGRWGELHRTGSQAMRPFHVTRRCWRPPVGRHGARTSAPA